ncbi:MAG: Elongation-Factor rhamnosyltransferase EarP [Pseudomonadota bacterium]
MRSFHQMCGRSLPRLLASVRRARSAIVFCRVVDHFGDAAFSWRLCCALKNCGVPSVTLIIDRPEVLLALHQADKLLTISRESGVRVRTTLGQRGLCGSPGEW